MTLDQRVGRLERALADLAEAQARTERTLAALVERVDRVEVALVRLAEAQARTEERLDRLAEAQARTEERLAETQVALRALAQQVGKMSDTIGFTLEDLAREVPPAYLARHYRIEVESLERRFFLLDGQEVEVDLYGIGARDGQTVAIVGEVRSRIHGRDVEAAVRQAHRLAEQLPATPVPVLFGFVIHPSAREVAEGLGAILISSSGR